MSRPAVFLDRDGVLIDNRSDYVRSWGQVEFLPGSIEAVEQLNASGYVIVIVTNQSLVGRGIISLEEAKRINQQVVDEVAVKGGRIDASYICPHGPEEGCQCRKPEPGMLLQAVAELNLDLQKSYLVGDALSDAEAGRRAGVLSILVRTGLGSEQEDLAPAELQTTLPVVDDLPAAVEYILRQEGKTV